MGPQGCACLGEAVSLGISWPRAWKNWGPGGVGPADLTPLLSQTALSSQAGGVLLSAQSGFCVSALCSC